MEQEAAVSESGTRRTLTLFGRAREISRGDGAVGITVMSHCSDAPQ
jgi:hypothetical protein